MANDGQHETNVKRVPADSKDVNVKTISRVTVFFQKFPGIYGEAAQRGIPEVDYKVFHDGVEVPTLAGKTDARGAVELDLAPDRKIELEIFNTRYAIKKVIAESIKDKPRKDVPAGDGSGLKGVARRLEILGYEPGPVEAKESHALDLAVARFEADSKLHPIGVSPDLASPEDSHVETRYGVEQVGGKRTLDTLSAAADSKD
ncbi:MAG: hypothetical protein U0271_47270 [Polyangiaceae bacterium]